jgi:hypothetical protein
MGATASVDGGGNDGHALPYVEAVSVSRPDVLATRRAASYGARLPQGWDLPMAPMMLDGPTVRDMRRTTDAPLPLTDGQAIQMARRLRIEYGIPYRTLAVVMGVYHGQWSEERHWRYALRARGVPTMTQMARPQSGR